MMPLLIAGGAILLVAFILINIFNKFARNRNVVQDAWSNIDVQLKRRHDLIPNLVNTVKGYAMHESGTLEKVIQARNAAVTVKAEDINAKIAAENQLQQSLRSIFALQETYPDLKANTNFLDLENKLTEIEDTLERSRRYYNATVRDNNTYGETFHAAMFAGMLKFKHFDYFQADEASRENVAVDFSELKQ